MTKGKIKALVKQSYKNNNLDEGVVEKIASLLTRKDLKQYLKEMKLSEKKKTVIVSLPSLPKKNDQKKIQQLFPDKKIVYLVDPELMVGIKVINNDLISELSLKESFNNLLFYLSEGYD